MEIAGKHAAKVRVPPPPSAGAPLPREIESGFRLEKGELSRLKHQLGKPLRVEHHDNLYFEKPTKGWTVRLRKVSVKGQPGETYVLTVKGDKKWLRPFKSRVEVEANVPKAIWDAHLDPSRPSDIGPHVAKLFEDRGVPLPPGLDATELRLLGGAPTMSHTKRSVYELPGAPGRHVEVDQTRYLDSTRDHVVELEVGDASEMVSALAQIEWLFARAKVPLRVNEGGKGSRTRALVKAMQTDAFAPSDAPKPSPLAL